MARFLAVAYLLLFAIALGLVALGALSNSYVVIGLAALAGSLVTLIAAVHIWRDR